MGFYDEIAYPKQEESSQIGSTESPRTSPYLSPRKPPVAKKVAMYCPSTPRANNTVHAPEDRFVLKEIRIPRAKQRERINTSFIVDQILGEADRENRHFRILAGFFFIAAVILLFFGLRPLNPRVPRSKNWFSKIPESVTTVAGMALAAGAAGYFYDQMDPKPAAQKAEPFSFMPYAAAATMAGGVVMVCEAAWDFASSYFTPKKVSKKQ